MHDGMEQQTQRIYQYMALLALDLLARIVTMRINAGPPCMGSLLSSGLRAAIFLSRFIDRFLCSTWNPVSSPRPAVLQGRRAQELSRLAVAPTLRRTVPLPGHIDSFEHDRTVGAVGMTIRGEPLSGRGSIAPRPCIRWVQ